MLMSCMKLEGECDHFHQSIALQSKKAHLMKRQPVTQLLCNEVRNAAALLFSDICFNILISSYFPEGKSLPGRKGNEIASLSNNL